jgi:putative transposase
MEMGSLFRWQRNAAEDAKLGSAWPVPHKANWIDHVNMPQTEAELQAIRRGIDRGRPFGDEDWSDRAVRRLGLETTLRPRGRPKKWS